MRRRDLLILIAILLLAAGVRAHRLNAQSLWADEFATAMLPRGYGYANHDLPRNVLITDPPDLFDLRTARPLHAVWYSERRQHVPPLYHFVMRLWGEVFGLGQASLRASSVVFSLAAIGVLFVVVRDLAGAAPALWAALLMALAGTQIQFAQEARNYTLLLLEGLGAAAALVRIEKRGPSRLREATLALCVLAMALTHYFSIGAIAALAVYALLRLRGRTLARVGACFAVAAAAWGVLGAPVAIAQARHIADPRSTFFLEDDAPNRVLGNLERLALLPARFFTEPMLRSRPVAAVAGGVALVACPLLAWRGRRREPDGERVGPDLVLWALWLWLTILPLLALDVVRGTQHLTYIRYALLASPAVYAIVAAVLADERGRRGWLAHAPPAAAALACVLALPAAYTGWWKADWRAFGAAIDRHRRPGDVVVFVDLGEDRNYAGDPAGNVLFTSYYRRPPFGPTVLMDRPPDAPLARQLRNAGRALVIAETDEEVSRAVPAARLRRLFYEPAAAALWLAEWPATGTSVEGPQTRPAAQGR